jgi:hypothetical protein
LAKFGSRVGFVLLANVPCSEGIVFYFYIELIPVEKAVMSINIKIYQSAN